MKARSTGTTATRSPMRWCAPPDCPDARPDTLSDEHPGEHGRPSCTVLEELGVDSPRAASGRKSLSTALRTEGGGGARLCIPAEATKPYSAETDGLRAGAMSVMRRAACTTEFKRLRCPYDETREFYVLPDENTDAADQHKGTAQSFDAAILNWEANRRPMSAAYDKTPSVQTTLKELLPVGRVSRVPVAAV